VIAKHFASRVLIHYKLFDDTFQISFEADLISKGGPTCEFDEPSVNARWLAIVRVIIRWTIYHFVDCPVTPWKSMPIASKFCQIYNISVIDKKRHACQPSSNCEPSDSELKWIELPILMARQEETISLKGNYREAIDSFRVLMRWWPANEHCLLVGQLTLAEDIIWEARNGQWNSVESRRYWGIRPLNFASTEEFLRATQLCWDWLRRGDERSRNQANLYSRNLQINWIPMIFALYFIKQSEESGILAIDAQTFDQYSWSALDMQNKWIDNLEIRRGRKVMRMYPDFYLSMK
jgi:hypothetical protein